MRGIIVGTVVACAALIGLAVFFTVNSSDQGPRLTPIDKQYETRVADGYWKKGAENPKVTVTEYLDFQCPACYVAFPLMQEVYNQTQDIAQFQTKMYPIVSIHDKAKTSARAAEAAGRQGKFWEMHDILFTNQKAWERQTPVQFETTVELYAESLNLNIEQFRRDIQDSSIQDPIDKDVTAGNSLPIGGTPSFLINGQLLQRTPQNVEEFVNLIRQAAGETTASAAPAA
jgi:protein-disulfide isomerase